MQTGIAGLPAPQLRDVRWIDGSGEERGPLSLDDLGDGYRILYFFQHWCPGCHAHGFPTLVRLVAELADRNVGFAAIQTVFEGFEVNTFERIRDNQQRYGRSDEHTSELQPLMRNSYAGFYLKKKII